MGLYINPVGQVTKENWLLDHGTEIDQLPETFDYYPDHYSVVLVYNGHAFTAAGILHSQHELDYVNRANKTDTREKKFYKCKISDLLIVCPELVEKFSAN